MQSGVDSRLGMSTTKQLILKLSMSGQVNTINIYSTNHDAYAVL